MTHNDKPNTNFWFGFALGSITLTAAAYMLGTKKGREKLKQLLEYADTIEDMPEELFRLLPSIREMLKKDSSQSGHEVGLETDSAKTKTTTEKDSFSDNITQSLESIMDKMKQNAEENKPEKKYFVKQEA